MAFKQSTDKISGGMRCQRCQGRMVFEKFYGQSNSFHGWHCVLCGDILDPVILLHRLSQDADVSIPESEEEIMALLKRLVSGRRKGSKHRIENEEV